MSTPTQPKSIWHPVSELPLQNQRIYVLRDDGLLYTSVCRGPLNYDSCFWTTFEELLAACPLPEPETPEDKTRREFEKWYVREGGSRLAFKKEVSGHYRLPSITNMLDAFRAGATVRAGGAV